MGKNSIGAGGLTSAFPNLSSETKGPFGLPQSTEELIVIKAYRLICVHVEGLLIVTRKL